MNKNYKNHLELKYGKYDKGLIESLESGKENIHDDATWKEFLNDWNNWSEKEKREYLYYISFVEGGHYIKWFFLFIVITSFLIGFSASYYFKF